MFSFCLFAPSVGNGLVGEFHPVFRKNIFSLCRACRIIYRFLIIADVGGFRFIAAAAEADQIIPVQFVIIGKKSSGKFQGIRRNIVRCIRE